MAKAKFRTYENKYHFRAVEHQGVIDGIVRMETDRYPRVITGLCAFFDNSKGAFELLPSDGMFFYGTYKELLKWYHREETPWQLDLRQYRDKGDLSSTRYLIPLTHLTLVDGQTSIVNNLVETLQEHFTEWSSELSASPIAQDQVPTRVRGIPQLYLNMMWEKGSYLHRNAKINVKKQMFVAPTIPPRF